MNSFKKLLVERPLFPINFQQTKASDDLGRSEDDRDDLDGIGETQ